MSQQTSSFFTSLYFTLVSAVALFTLMFGLIDFLTIGLKTYVFPVADRPSWGINDCSAPNSLDEFKFRVGESEIDEEELMRRCELQNEQRMREYEAQKAESSVRNLALIIISLPLFLIHFRFVRQEWLNRDKKAKK